MSAGLDWRRDGGDWPNRDASRFVEAGGVRFHVQVAGSGPVALLLHGTGASTHSWRDVLPRLTGALTVVAPDLPGHGFSSLPRAEGLSLPGMARSLGLLLATVGLTPAIAVGHSAGAAILAAMCLAGSIAPHTLVSLNGAFLPPPMPFFAPAARLLARLPLVPDAFAALAGNQRGVARLIEQTGSRIDPRGMALYERLVRDPGHVAGALGMMAHWDLEPLYQQLPRLRPRLVLVVGDNDRTIPPAEARRLLRRMPAATIVKLPGLGHLAHEERPDEAAALILRLAVAPS